MMWKICNYLSFFFFSPFLLQVSESHPSILYRESETCDRMANNIEIGDDPVSKHTHYVEIFIHFSPFLLTSSISLPDTHTCMQCERKRFFKMQILMRRKRKYDKYSNSKTFYSARYRRLYYNLQRNAHASSSPEWKTKCKYDWKWNAKRDITCQIRWLSAHRHIRLTIHLWTEAKTGPRTLEWKIVFPSTRKPFWFFTYCLNNVCIYCWCCRVHGDDSQQLRPRRRRHTQKNGIVE